MKKPDHYDPLLEILRERGQRHKDAYIEHLRAQGHQVTEIEGVDITDKTANATLEAMRMAVPRSFDNLLAGIAEREERLNQVS